MTNGEKYTTKLVLSTFVYRILALVKKQGIPTAITPLRDRQPLLS